MSDRHATICADVNLFARKFGPVVTNMATMGRHNRQIKVLWQPTWLQVCQVPNSRRLMRRLMGRLALARGHPWAS